MAEKGVEHSRENLRSVWWCEAAKRFRSMLITLLIVYSSMSASLIRRQPDQSSVFPRRRDSGITPRSFTLCHNARVTSAIVKIFACNRTIGHFTFRSRVIARIITLSFLFSRRRSRIVQPLVDSFLRIENERSKRKRESRARGSFASRPYPGNDKQCSWTS